MEKDLGKILNELTIEEKASLCSGADFWHLKGIDRLGIPSIMVTDGPHGLRKQEGSSDHVGLSDSVKATCFPTASATASSWDVELLGEMGIALGEACVQEDVAVLLGPGANIKRSPLCGRNFEYISEDPYLTGKLGAALVRGVQSKGVGTSLKHFAVNNQESRRMSIESLVDERALREIYLAGFEEIVKMAQPWTVMCAYNKLEGKYCSDNKRLLTTILKDEWKHTGLVVTDWGACNDRVEGIRAGMELEMPSSNGINDAKIVDAVKNGSLSMEELDSAVLRILTLIDRSLEIDKSQYKYNAKAHHTLARKIAAHSAVLLKNKEGILPLKDNKRFAVIGEFARTPRYQGAGSSQIQPLQIDHALEGFDAANAAYDFYPGYDLRTTEINRQMIDEAVNGSKKVDTAIVFVGLTDDYESEGFDRKHLLMPESHNALVHAVAKAYSKVIVILQNGAPVEMPWLDEVDGVLECYLGGQAGGMAVVDLLYGYVNPSGKLAETFPKKLEDDFASKWFGMGPKTVEYRESVYVGYRYYDTAGVEVAFPFGFGLSYTTFEYSSLKLSQHNIKDDQPLTVTFKVKNTGLVAGAEVVQLYVRDAMSTIFRPDKELKGFDKVYLEPNEEKEVTLILNKRSFAYYNTNVNNWHVESGQFQILVGASSRDIRLSETVFVESTEPTIIVPDYSLLTPEYYSLSEHKEGISDKSFRAVLGKEIPFNGYAKGEKFTMNATMEDISVHFVGRKIYQTVLKNMSENFGAQTTENDKRMVEAMVKDLPLRSMVLFSGGMMSFEMAEGLLMLVNKQYMRGAMKLIKSRKRK